MSKNVFYADLDIINSKGVFVTGHGKGIVNKNSLINGRYIADDMVRLTVEDGKLHGYQGYIDVPINQLTQIEYALYLCGKDEMNQPKQAQEVTISVYLQLSKHNMDCAEYILGKNAGDIYSEYENILMDVTTLRCFVIPYTSDENERATQINAVVK